jgi:hypothetical protein
MKLQTMVQRCVLLGCDIPSEQTCGHIIGAMLSLSQMQMGGKESFGLVHDFKRALRTAFKNTTGDVSITDYPPDPTLLPQQRLQWAYKDGLPTPMQSSTPTPSIQLRRSASSIRGNSAPSSSSQRISVAQTDGNNHMLLQLLQTVLGNHPMLQTPRANGINLQFLHNHRQSLPSAPSTGSPTPHTLAIADGTLAGTLPTGNTQAQPTLPPPAQEPSTPSSPRVNQSSPFQFPSLTPDQQSSTVLDAIAARSVARKSDEPQSSTSKGVKHSCMKRPAAANNATPTKTVKKAAAKAAGSNTSSATSSTMSGPRPAVPKPSSGTKFYRGGKIHESLAKQAWRVFIKKGDRCDKVCLSIQLCFLCVFHHISL